MQGVRRLVCLAERVRADTAVTTSILGGPTGFHEDKRWIQL